VIQSKAKLAVCIGVSGSGKTTLARALSENLEWQFVEADDFHNHQNIQSMQRGQALTDSMRVPWIKAIKTELERHARADQSCVLAFSGLGCQHRQAIRDLPFVSITFLHSQVPTDELERRMNQRSSHFMPASLLKSQLERFDSTDGENDILILDGTLSIDELVALAIKQLI
jgi:gluconokinase